MTLLKKRKTWLLRQILLLLPVPHTPWLAALFSESLCFSARGFPPFAGKTVLGGGLKWQRVNVLGGLTSVSATGNWWINTRLAAPLMGLGITQSPRSFPVNGGQLCTAATCSVMRSVSVSFRPYLVSPPPYPFLHIPNKLPSNPLSGFTPGQSKNNHIDDVLERRPCRGVWVQTWASSTFLQVTNFWASISSRIQ